MHALFLFLGSGSQAAGRKQQAASTTISGDSIRKYFAMSGDHPLQPESDAIGEGQEGLGDIESIEDVQS